MTCGREACLSRQVSREFGGRAKDRWLGLIVPVTCVVGWGTALMGIQARARARARAIISKNRVGPTPRGFDFGTLLNARIAPNTSIVRYTANLSFSLVISPIGVSKYSPTLHQYY